MSIDKIEKKLQEFDEYVSEFYSMLFKLHYNKSLRRLVRQCSVNDYIKIIDTNSQGYSLYYGGKEGFCYKRKGTNQYYKFSIINETFLSSSEKDEILEMFPGLSVNVIIYTINEAIKNAGLHNILGDIFVD